MIQIECFTYNPFQENTYLLINENKECWIVDPGMYESEEVSHFKSHIIVNKLIPRAIINTHTHLDHIFGVNALKETYNIPFSIHKSDEPVLNGAAGSAMLFRFNFRDIPKVDSYIDAGASIKIGDDTIDVLFTPGHSPGSITFYYPKGGWAIGGDVLFNGSIGRTDLPGGNHATLINSIKTQMFTLPDNTIVYSGHGPSTTIAHEKKYNPFLQD